MSPNKPGEKTLEELTTALKKYYDPTPSEIVQRYKFNSRYRQPTKTIATFISELRSLAEFCNYGTNLDEMLWDRVVCGINDSTIQCRLLLETKLALKTTLEIAQGMEPTTRNSDTLSQGESGGLKNPQAGGVHKLHTPSKSTTTVTNCYSCGKGGHSPTTYRFRDTKCHNCRKTGHLRRACQAKKQKQIGGPQVKMSVKCIVDESEETNDLVMEYSLYTVSTNKKPQPLMIPVKIEDINLSKKLDTGTSVSIISEKTYKKWWSSKPLAKSAVVLRTYTGEILDVKGSMEVKKHNVQLPLLVVKGEGSSLFG